MICLSLTASTLDENEHILLEHIQNSSIDLAELRADLLHGLFKNTALFGTGAKEQAQRICTWAIKQKKKARAKAQTPLLIFTLRTEKDGGACTPEQETARRELLSNIVNYNVFDYVDIECDDINFAQQTYTSSKTKLIISKHWFDDSWADTSETARTQQSVLEKTAYTITNMYPNAFIKVAIMCSSTSHLCKVFDICSVLSRDKRLRNKFICAPMGSFGKPARVLTIHTHSLWTYTSAYTQQSQTSTGLQKLFHFTPQELTDTYRYKKITKNTKLFAIIGNPVLHSKSPEFHNKKFIEKKIDAVYVHLPVDDCKHIPQLISSLHLCGLSVTVPHKTNIIALLTKKDPVVQDCQSCNTVIIFDDTIIGYNTDVGGFLAPLKKRCSLLQGKKATVIGSGGSAQAISYILVKEGVEVLIVNRTLEKAQKLSQKNGTDYTSLSDYKKIKEYSDIIVQSSSVGMDSTQESVLATPLKNFPFSGHEIVYDIIYTPAVTKFLQEAQDAGCTCISGKEMFIAQAELQAEYFCKRADG